MNKGTTQKNIFYLCKCCTIQCTSPQTDDVCSSVLNKTMQWVVNQH